MKASDGSLVSNLIDKANIIAKVYNEIHRQNRQMGDSEFYEVVKSEINAFCQTTTSALLGPHLKDADEIQGYQE